MVLSKLCPKLDETRLALVPDEVSETEFWRNFFYQIEHWRLQKGFSSKLGELIDPLERQQAQFAEIAKTEKEIEQLYKDHPLDTESDDPVYLDNGSSSQVDSTAETVSSEQPLANADRTSESTEVELQAMPAPGDNV